MPFRDTIALSTELLLALVARAGASPPSAARSSPPSPRLSRRCWSTGSSCLPYGTLTIAEGENIIALVVFVGVAVDGRVTGRSSSSKRSLEARRARLEAEALARSTTSLAADPEPLPRLLDQLHADVRPQRCADRPRRSTDRIGRRSRQRATSSGSPTASIALASTRAGVTRAAIHARGLRQRRCRPTITACCECWPTSWRCRSTVDG